MLGKRTYSATQAADKNARYTRSVMLDSSGRNRATALTPARCLAFTAAHNLC